MSAQSITVKGRVATTASYVEVNVNNRHALVNGNDFLFPDLVLEPGENTVTVRAVDSNGNSAQAEHVVNMSGTDDWLELQLGEAGGFAPLETVLSIVPHLQKSLNWDTAVLEGSGPADVVITGAAEEGYQLTFSDPGMYSLDFQIRDIDGTVYQERAFVSVLQPFTSADWQAMNEGVKQLEDNFTTLLATVGVESARQEVLEQAKENPDFSSATLSSGALCLVFKGLIPVILDLPDPNAPPTD